MTLKKLLPNLSIDTSKYILLTIFVENIRVIR